MSEPLEMADRHSQILTELSQLGLVLARDLQARAMAAQDDATAAELGLAFHRISRSVRQTLALEARLERDRVRRHLERRAEAARETEVRVARRRSEIHSAMEHAIWTETEREEVDSLMEYLDDSLDLAARSDGFMEETVETHVARLRIDLGLPVRAPAPADAPPVPQPAGTAYSSAPAESLADPGWRSSA